MDNKYDLYRLVVLGDSGVGRKGVVNRLVYDSLHVPRDCMPISGLDFKQKFIEMKGKKIKLQIWDADSRLVRFGLIYPSRFRIAHGIVFVYDVTNQISFDNIKMWNEIVDIVASKNVPRLLIGNKCDSTENKVVEYVTAKEFADQLGIPFFETSAKDGTNVEQAFMTLAAEIQKIYVPPTPTPVPSKHQESSDQGGILSSIFGSFYNFFGFGEKNSDASTNKLETTSVEEKSDKKIIVQVANDKETEMLLDDFKEAYRNGKMRYAVLKIGGREFKLQGQLA